MSGGRASVACLICSHRFVVKDIMDHIHKHIDYEPQKCNDCGFKSIHRNELDQHTFEFDHEGSQLFDPYKQWLVDSINNDCQFAAKHGMEELLKKKNISHPHRSTPSLSSHSPQQRKCPPLPRLASPPAIIESSSDEEEEPQRQPARLPVVPKRRSDTKPASKQQRNSDDEASDGDSGDEDKGVEQLRKEMDKYVECTMCRKVVPLSLADRLKHIRDKHMDGVRAGDEYEAQLEKRTLKAFPGEVWLITQCARCPNKNAIQTAGGRLTHVVSYHFNYFKDPLRCPKQGCRYYGYSPANFKKHFMDAHGATNEWKLFLDGKERDFIATMKKYKIKQEQISRLLFAVDFPSKAPNYVTPKRKTNDDEDEEEAAEQLRAMVAAAPSRPTASQPMARKRHRSKSFSSTSEEGSEDEQPSSSNKVVKRRSDLSMTLMEISDEEEEGDGEVDVDSKEDAKSGASYGGSSCSNAASRSGTPNQEEVKVEEEDVKQEPVTPRDRARVGLPTLFTGRTITEPAPAVSPFPTQRDSIEARNRALRSERAQRNREGRGGGGNGGGMQSGGGGQRGTPNGTNGHRGGRGNFRGGRIF